jgi:hypothetical protein
MTSTTPPPEPLWVRARRLREAGEDVRLAQLVAVHEALDALLSHDLHVVITRPRRKR